LTSVKGAATTNRYPGPDRKNRAYQMPQYADRRKLFREIAGRSAPLRPPRALPEARLAAVCDGCGDCIGACPSSILVPGRGALPAVDFSRGGCTFCGRCADACTRGAFVPGRAAWPLKARVSDACLEQRGIACRVCETACDTAALRFRPAPGGRAQVLVAADRCTGCGACIAICPTAAISVAEPAEFEDASA